MPDGDRFDVRERLREHTYSSLRMVVLDPSPDRIEHLGRIITRTLVMYRSGHYGMVPTEDLIRVEPDLLDLIAFPGMLRRHYA